MPRLSVFLLWLPLSDSSRFAEQSGALAARRVSLASASAEPGKCCAGGKCSELYKRDGCPKSAGKSKTLKCEDYFVVLKGEAHVCAGNESSCWPDKGCSPKPAWASCKGRENVDDCQVAGTDETQCSRLRQGRALCIFNGKSYCGRGEAGGVLNVMLKVMRKKAPNNNCGALDSSNCSGYQDLEGHNCEWHGPVCTTVEHPRARGNWQRDEFVKGTGDYYCQD